jgi:hypothetical protein
MLGSEWLIGLVCVVFFFGAGRQEARFGGHDHSALWAALSIGLSALIILVFKSTAPVLFVSQVGLFIGIAVVRALHDKP